MRVPRRAVVPRSSRDVPVRPRRCAALRCRCGLRRSGDARRPSRRAVERRARPPAAGDDRCEPVLRGPYGRSSRRPRRPAGPALPDGPRPTARALPGLGAARATGSRRPAAVPVAVADRPGAAPATRSSHRRPRWRGTRPPPTAGARTGARGAARSPGRSRPVRAAGRAGRGQVDDPRRRAGRPSTPPVDRTGRGTRPRAHPERAPDPAVRAPGRRRPSATAPPPAQRRPGRRPAPRATGCSTRAPRVRTSASCSRGSPTGGWRIRGRTACTAGAPPPWSRRPAPRGPAGRRAGPAPGGRPRGPSPRPGCPHCGRLAGENYTV